MSADQQTPVPEAPPAIEKSYATELLLTLLLYVFVFPIGLIANAIYLADANAYRRRTGRDAILAPWVRRLMVLGVVLLVILNVLAYHFARTIRDMLQQTLPPEARRGPSDGAYFARASSHMARMFSSSTSGLMVLPVKRTRPALPRQTSMA